MKELSFFKNYARPGLIAGVQALLASTLVVATVAAHALLLKSEPEAGLALTQPPKQVITWFSQELDTGFSTLQVVDAEGRQVDNGDGGVDLNDPDHASMIVTMLPGLPDGVYRVRWTTVSAEDSDPTEGEFTFSIGDSEVVTSQAPSTKPTPVNDKGAFPLSWMVASLGVLLLVTLGLMLLHRDRARG